jgi:hypothetical protein
MVFVKDLRDEEGDMGQGVVRVSHGLTGEEVRMGPALRVIVPQKEEDLLTREVVEA